MPTDAEDLRAIVRAWIEEGWRRGDPGVVDRLHAPDFTDHDPGGRTPDNAGFKEGIARLFAAFPDLAAEAQDLVVDTAAGTVAVRWSAAGTHLGAYLGAAPTGRTVRFKGIEIVRIRGGRITERWGEWDGIDLLAQLGRL
ncbi:MAG: ester cyclase [Krumholzibacteria bacterium]|nr:ester cyclase [Candidatus Krumholzibacteria bacterium]